MKLKYIQLSKLYTHMICIMYKYNYFYLFNRIIW